MRKPAKTRALKKVGKPSKVPMAQAAESAESRPRKTLYLTMEDLEMGQDRIRELLGLSQREHVVSPYDE